MNEELNKNKTSLNIEQYQKQEKLINYLKELGVIYHYAIAYQYADKISDIDNVKFNIQQIQNYLQEIDISQLINRNPNILLLSSSEFISRFEYLINEVGFEKNVIIINPKLLDEISEAKDFVKACELVNFDIKHFTNSSLLYGSLKTFIKILLSEEYKSHPELFTSTTLAHSTPDRIAAILHSEEYKSHPELFTSTTLAHGSASEIGRLIASEAFRKFSNVITSECIKGKKYVKERIVIKVRLADDYNIPHDLITSGFFSLTTVEQLYAILQYMKDNNISVILNGKIHPLLKSKPNIIKKVYGIDLKVIQSMYPLIEKYSYKESEENVRNR